MKIVKHIEQGTPDWHAWRNQGLGSSDAAAVLGACPYRTPLMVYREKTGLFVPDDEGKEYVFELGHLAEKKMRETLEARVGVKMPPICVEHDQYPELRASLDGRDDFLGGLEAKLVSLELFKEIERTSVLPRHHFIQVQHQLNVTKDSVVRYFAYNASLNQGIVIPVEPSPDTMREIEERLLAFWERVKAKQPPALSERDPKFIDDEESDAAFARMAEIKAQQDALTEEFDRLKLSVAERHQHPKLVSPHGMLLRQSRAGSINYKAIPAIKDMSELELNKYRGKESVTLTFRRGKL